MNLICIVIDFGTDGIGLAYAFDNDIHVHSKWSQNECGDQVKPKTIILLDENAETRGFAMDAKHKFGVDVLIVSRSSILNHKQLISIL